MIDVCFTPESGPFSAMAFMSANDPKLTLIGLASMKENLNSERNE